ncbi:helix-turn-helix transcriptional regulator [Paenibacillus xanthanilyticus]|uniref:Helix-turn-helix transcriptional regulator n=1 Tax=Paenibacillus xanthanilyticus TaxID=1783531 RepID=A0ABV8K171_9BACL
MEPFGDALPLKTPFRQEGGTRQTILMLLKTRAHMNAGDLARELNITEMGVRRHLSALERDGLIRPTLVRQSVGRPTLRYSLTEEAEHVFPKTYSSLALDLLEELEGDPDAEGLIARMFEGRKRKLLERHAGRMGGKDLAARVRELADIQNDGGYMVSMESGGDELILHEYNCPIAQVAARYEQACQCELALFRELLAADVERTECLAKGGMKCTYRIARMTRESD